MKKVSVTLLLAALLLLLIIPAALADLGTILGNVWDKIMYGAGLGFLGLNPDRTIVAFTRILLWILMFTVFFAVLSSLGGRDGQALSFLKRNHAIVVAAAIATIAAIFFPPAVILAVGTSWAAAVAFLLIGGPIAGIGYLLWQIPFDGEETRGTVFLKFLLVLLLFWILSVMKFYVGRLGVA